MGLSMLLTVAVTFLLLTAALVALLFGREWLVEAQGIRFARKLEKHSELVEQVRNISATTFGEVSQKLEALRDTRLCEGVLDVARKAAPIESIPFIARAYDEQGITARYLEEVERSPSWQQRAVAAERLGVIGSSRAVPVLLRVIGNVKDEDQDVRGAALRAIGRIGDQAALPALIEALEFPDASLPPRIAEIIVGFGHAAVRPLVSELRNVASDVRRMWAAEILGWLGDPKAAVPLIEALGDINPEVRAKAAGSLGKLKESRAVDRLLEMILSDPIPFVRTRVAHTLGTIGHPKVVDHLIHVLKDPEWWVRIRAIEALEQIGKASSAALIVALEDEDAEVRHRAATALERMGYVQESIERMESEGYRPDLSRILLLIGKSGVIEVLLAMLPRVQDAGRNFLVRLLGDIGNPESGPILTELLAKCEEPRLRSRLVTSLGKIGFREAMPAILDCLSDPDEWVRQASVEALSVLAPDEHAEKVLHLLKDPVPTTRVAACRLIASMKQERFLSTITDLLMDPAPEVRREALRAVHKWGSHGYGNLAQLLLSDPSDEVRLEAARALSVVGRRESVAHLLATGTRASEAMVQEIIAALLHCHDGMFDDILALAPKALTPSLISVLLELASRTTGHGRLEFIEGYLRSDDARLRRCAVFALRAFCDARVVGHIERAGRDPDEKVREAAVTVAGLSSELDLVRKIEPLAGDPQAGVRFRVGLALGMSELDAFWKTLVGLGKDKAPAVRAAAAMGLALHNRQEFLKLVKEYARDEELCDAARDIFVEGSHDPLIAKIVQEAASRERLETRLFLGGSRYALEKEMAQLARSALEPAERVRALEVWQAVATGQYYTTALSILKNDPSPEVRSRALDLIVAVRQDPEVARVVGSILLDPHPLLRVKAAIILGRMEFIEAIEALVHALDTNDRDLREAVTTSLSDHLRRDPKRAEELMKEIPSLKTRKIGLVWLLGKTRPAGAIKMLLKFLHDSDGDVRAAAVGALSKFRVGVVTRSLQKTLDDPNERVRAATVNALGSVRSPERESTLERMLTDPDAFVRRRAAFYLLKMKSSIASSRVQRFRKEPSELQPVWVAGAVLEGICSPFEAVRYPGAVDFLQELFPESEAEAAIRGALEPARRLAAFRVLCAVSREKAILAARILAQDPAPDIRDEAESVLRRTEARVA
jgi:HEAT repeat protein